MIKRYVTFIVRFPWLIILAAVVLTLLFGSQFWNLEMVLDPKRILPQGHPYVKLNNEIERRFGGSRVVVIGVVAKEGDIFNAKTLAKIKRITEKVKGVPGIIEENVVSIADRKIKVIKASPSGLDIHRLMEEVPKNQKEMDALRANIFANDMYVGSLVSADGRAAAIITDFQGGAALEQYWQSESEKDSSGEDQASQENTGKKPWEKWSKEEQESYGGPDDSQEDLGETPKQGDTTWRVGEAFAQSSVVENQEVEEEPWKKWAGGGESWYVSDSAIYDSLLAIVATEQDSETDIHIGGLPVSLAFLEKDARLMNQVVFPLAVFVIMLVLYMSFRSFQGMIIPVLTALMSVVWAIGMMGLFRIPLDPWTQTLTPILIVAIAAGHSLQMLKRYYEELNRLGASPSADQSEWDRHRSAVIESASKMIPVMVTAGLVAATAFASLITFELKSFQAFGLLTAFGILSAVILEMTFIPACRILMRPPKVDLTQARGGLLGLFLGWVGRYIVLSSPGNKGAKGAKITLVVGLVLALVASVAASQVQVNNSLKAQFFERTQFRQDDAVLNQMFGGTSTFYVLIQVKERNGLKNPQIMRKIEGLQRLIDGVPDVGKTQSYVDYLKKMNQSWHGGDPVYNAIPKTQSEVAEFLFLYSISGNPADFDRLVDYDYQQAVIWAFLKNDSTKLAEDLIFKVNQYANEHFDEFRVVGLQDKGQEKQDASIIEDLSACGVKENCIGVAGSAPVTVALNQTLVEGKIENIFQIGFIAFLVSSLVLRSLLGGMLVLLPLALAVLLNFGVMGVAGITLGIGTAAISAMAVGMGADYAIYFLFRLREEWKREGNLETALILTLNTAGKAVLTVAIAISAGCLTLIFPGYYLHMEGILVPLAMVTSSIGALTLLPALVMLLKPRFLSGR